MSSREQHLQEIADNITALTVETTTSAQVHRQPGPGEDGIRRRTPETITYRLRHPSLLQQLTANLLPGSPPADGAGTRHTKPGSRPPSAQAASAALDAITNGWAANSDDWRIGVLAMQARMRAAARRPGPPRRPLTGALEDIRALAHVLPEPWSDEAAFASRSWMQRAEQALALTGPVATLAQVVCPECRTSLKVAHDAPDEAWCPNRSCRDPEGRQYRWAGEQVAFLLERLAAGQTEEGAA